MRAWAVWIAVIAGVLGPLQVQAQVRPLVLEGGTLIDGTGSAPINDAVIVIDGNPLNDIAMTQNVRMVIKDGQVLDTTYDSRFVNPLPRPVDVAPQLSMLNPRATPQGSRSVTLQIEGTGFGPKSVVRFDNTDLRTQFVSKTRLTATIDARLLRNVGTYTVHVLNRGQPGGVSSGVYFLVNFQD